MTLLCTDSESVLCGALDRLALLSFALGERFIERALSASVTCRLQGLSMFSYMTELLTAHARGDPLPTLA